MTALEPAVRPRSTVPVRALVTVRVPAEDAFRVFTDGLDRWWPRDLAVGDAPLQETVLEPREGGRWFERDAAGDEHDWGRVLRWQAPARLVLAWQLDGTWTPDPDVAHASQVEVLFVAEDAASTRVELVHCGFERHRDGGEAVRQGVTEPGGWEALLELFAQAAERSSRG